MLRLVFASACPQHSLHSHLAFLALMHWFFPKAVFVAKAFEHLSCVACPLPRMTVRGFVVDCSCIQMANLQSVFKEEITFDDGDKALLSGSKDRSTGE